MFSLRTFLGLWLVLASASTVQAAPIIVTMSGTIGGVFDNTTSLDGSGIANGSTFTATFSYELLTVPNFSFDNGTTQAAYYQTGPFSLTIDGTHTFTANPTSEIRIINDDPNFNDRLDAWPDLALSANVSFPFAFNQNDNLLRLSLQDATGTVFSDGSLPDAGLFNLPVSSFSTRELFIRTDLDRSTGQLWFISGTITSMSAQQVPEPSIPALLTLVALAYTRRKRKH